MVYDFHCSHCDQRFTQNVVIGTGSTPCPQCQESARKLFDPHAAVIHIPGHMKNVRGDFRLPSSATKTADYLESELLDRHMNEMYAAQERLKRPDFSREFLKENQDIDPNAKITKEESQELKQLLNGTPCRTPA